MAAIHPLFLRIAVLSLGVIALFTSSAQVSAASLTPDKPLHQKNATVLILGGGVAGVIAARTLHEQGITSFKIVEARGT